MRTAVLLLLSLLVPPALLAGADREAEMSIMVGGPFGRMIIRPRVQPMSAIKHRNVVKQGLDFSCGAAATATLFNYYLGHPTTEAKVIEGLFRVGNVDKIMARQGFSLLDIKRFSEDMGYKAQGYKTDLEGLLLLNKPALVPILIRDYKHFVIFKGIAGGRVFLADPALGNTTVSTTEFEKMWQGVALVIEPRDGRGTEGLKIEEEEMQFIASQAIGRTLFPTSLAIIKSPREF